MAYTSTKRSASAAIVIETSTTLLLRSVAFSEFIVLSGMEILMGMLKVPSSPIKLCTVHCSVSIDLWER